TCRSAAASRYGRAPGPGRPTAARCPGPSAVPGRGCMPIAGAPLLACLPFAAGVFRLARDRPSARRYLRACFVSWLRLPWLRRFLLAVRPAHGRAVPFGDPLDFGAA